MTVPTTPRGAAVGERTYDVAILGGHLATYALATVLARKGVDVLLVDPPDDHWRVGATTVPYTAEVFFLLGRRFDVPELTALGRLSDLPTALRDTCGVKRSLTYLWHGEEQAHRPKDLVQFNVPGEHSEWHVYRPTVEAWLRDVAASYGVATVKGRPAVTDVATDAFGATVTTADGGAHRARFVVDGSGPSSVLAARHDSPRLPVMERAVMYVADMVDVDMFVPPVPLADYGSITPFSAGTTHHVFDGGWVQVASFGNHPGATTRHTNVVVSLDPTKHDATAADPSAVLRRYPTIAAQLDRGRLLGPWRRHEVGGPALETALGERYFLFERTVIDGDLFLARDVTVGAEVAHATAVGLLDMAARDDWSASGLVAADVLQRELSVLYDRMFAAARAAATSFPTWNAFARVWLLWSMLEALCLKRARNDALNPGRPETWDGVEIFDGSAWWFRMHPGLRPLVERTIESLLDIERLGRDPQDVADDIFGDLDRARFTPPLYGFADPEDRFYDFTPLRRLRTLVWSRTAAPKDLRRLLAA